VFSYLETVKDLVNPGIQARGVRYFLDGFVGGYEEMVLDFWRLYKVSGSQTYAVKFPLIHLALSPSKFNFAAKAIQESAECDCPYYFENGICKHIVAVCAALDQEFDLKLAKSKQNIAKKESTELLETIFEADKTKQIRRFESNFEGYLLSSRLNNFRWLEVFCWAVIDSPQEYAEYLSRFKTIISRYLSDFDKEQKILKMIPKSLIYGKKIWWDFWHANFPQIGSKKLFDLWAEIWELRMLNLAGEFQEQVDQELSQMEDSEKDEILQRLQQKFNFNKDFWIEYLFVCKYWAWFEKNLNTLDPQNLFRVVSIWPEMQDLVEQIVYQQAKVWADFLQPQSYDEVVELFKNWEDKIGRTEIFERALDYFKDLHPKKKSLLKKLEKGA